MSRWLWTTRPGFEEDLAEELTRAGRHVTPFGPALVETDVPPPDAKWPVFARAGCALIDELDADADGVAKALAKALTPTTGTKIRSWTLQAWVPDADFTNPLAADADALAAAAQKRLETLRPELALRRVDDAAAAHRLDGMLAQVVMVAPRRAVVGILPAAQPPTLAPGGRARTAAPKTAPSRAARKLGEAFAWIGRTPEAGDRCVDLGAAPGGWTAVLLEHRAKVIAVDPAKLEPQLASNKNLAHVMASAFDFAPDAPVDWLLCDMAWRPVEVAQLLAKWGRRRWASTLVANIKLPMKQRVDFVEKVLETVAEGGWQGVRGRQLYHDREEITISAWRT